jgi:hypothetical protein
MFPAILVRSCMTGEDAQALFLAKNKSEYEDTFKVYNNVGDMFGKRGINLGGTFAIGSETYTIIGATHRRRDMHIVFTDTKGRIKTAPLETVEKIVQPPAAVAGEAQ